MSRSNWEEDQFKEVTGQDLVDHADEADWRYEMWKDKQMNPPKVMGKMIDLEPYKPLRQGRVRWGQFYADIFWLTLIILIITMLWVACTM